MIIRSLFFFVGFFTVLFAICSVSLVIGFFLPMSWRMGVSILTEKWITFWLRLVCNIRVEIEGKEHLQVISNNRKMGQSYIVIANHQSPWETFYLQSIFYPLVTVLKKELVYIPIWGWSLLFLRPIVVNRSKAIHAMGKVLQQGQERLAAGYNLLIFPQGTRVALGKEGNFSRSAAQLAVKANVNIVPVVHNAGKYWPAHGIKMKPGVIRVVIGAPIECSNRTANEISSIYRAWMLELLEKN